MGRGLIDGPEGTSIMRARARFPKRDWIGTRCETAAAPATV